MGAVSVLGIISIAISLVVTSGAVAFVFKYGIRLAVQESKQKDFSDKIDKQAELDKRLSIVEEVLREFKKVADELGRLPSIEQKMEQLVDMLKSQVPRNELELHFQTLEDRLKNIEDLPRSRTKRK